MDTFSSVLVLLFLFACWLVAHLHVKHMEKKDASRLRAARIFRVLAPIVMAIALLLLLALPSDGAELTFSLLGKHSTSNNFAGILFNDYSINYFSVLGEYKITSEKVSITLIAESYTYFNAKKRYYEAGVFVISEVQVGKFTLETDVLPVCFKKRGQFNWGWVGLGQISLDLFVRPKFGYGFAHIVRRSELDGYVLNFGLRKDIPLKTISDDANIRLDVDLYLVRGLFGVTSNTPALNLELKNIRLTKSSPFRFGIQINYINPNNSKDNVAVAGSIAYDIK